MVEAAASGPAQFDLSRDELAHAVVIKDQLARLSLSYVLHVELL